VIRLDPLNRDHHGDLVAIHERRCADEHEYDDRADKHFFHAYFLPANKDELLCKQRAMNVFADTVFALRHFALLNFLLLTARASRIQDAVASASLMPAMADQGRVRRNG
jgi:hypothetical protein